MKITNANVLLTPAFYVLQLNLLGISLLSATMLLQLTLH